VIRLLAIDIDGTLLDSHGRLPDAHREALIEASGRGVEIALVTGRSFHFTAPLAALLPVPLTLIVNNGAVVKRKTGETELRHVLSREAARRVLDETGHLEDSVAIVFDSPRRAQIVFERMDWSHPNRRGYYEKNKAFIAAAGGPLRDMLAEDPIQVMFNGGVEVMRALVASLRALPIADRFSVAITELPGARFLAGRRQRRRLLEGEPRSPPGSSGAAGRRRTSRPSATTSTTSRCWTSPAPPT